MNARETGEFAPQDDRVCDEAKIDPVDRFDRLAGSAGILLAVSGGADSTALMLLAARWRDRSDNAPPLHVATVDHGLRTEAQGETRLVADNAERLGLNCTIMTAQLAEDDQGSAGNLQARARRARYRCLVQAARAAGCDTIATAHHQDDQAETFLLRLARGSGVYGLGAMRETSELAGLTLARPLLGCQRRELHRLVAASGLAWVDDPSNRDMAFARIRCRSVMPQLEQAGVTASGVAETALRLQRAGDALDHYAAELLRAHVSIDSFGAAAADAGFFAEAPEEVTLRAFARLLQAVGGTDYTPRLDRLERLLAAIRERISVSGDLKNTLNGCTVDLKSEHMCVEREWGRAGPAHIAAPPGAEIAWDGRFILSVPADFPDGLVAGPLGDHAGQFPVRQKTFVLQAIPGLFAGGTLFALPTVGNLIDAGERPAFACESLVEARLFNPRSNRIGVIADISC